MASLTEPADLRLRFHGALRELSPLAAGRLAQIDYDREMVLVATEPAGAIAGVVRLVFDPEFETAECAIIVRSDRQRRGLGGRLLKEALAYADSHGASRVWGDVLRENAPTIDLGRRLGGKVSDSPIDRQHVRVTFVLARATPSNASRERSSPN
jgi:acetyltransferase